MVANLLKGADFKFVHSETTTASTESTNQTNGPVDMQGYDACCFIGLVNDLTAAGDVGLEMWHGDSSGGTFYHCATAYDASMITTTTATNISLLVIDVQKPQKRWLSCRVHHATQVSCVNVVAIKYNTKEYPVAGSSGSTGNYGIAVGVLSVSPTS